MISSGIALATLALMPLKKWSGVLALTCAFAAWGCSNGTLPASPSTLTPLASPGAGGGTSRPLDDPMPAGDPAPPAPTDPAPAPPTPMQVIIAIVSSFGSGAYTPNPIQANVGDSIVWTNNDSVTHHIVLDDGTDLGIVAPGQSSAPVALATPTATFHCSIHPSMIGSINGPIPPPPVYEPPPDDYYGYY